MSYTIQVPSFRRITTSNGPCTDPQKARLGQVRLFSSDRRWDSVMFHIDVYKSGRFSHSVERRYSQFEDLHKELRKFHTSRTSFKLPALPPKKVLKFNNKVIEQRRLDLQHYLQNIAGHFQSHQLVLEFMDLSRHSPTECEDTTTIMQNECTSYSIPVVRFTDLDVTNQKLVDPDDMITSAVLSSLYPPSSTTSSSSRDSLHGYVS